MKTEKMEKTEKKGEKLVEKKVLGQEMYEESTNEFLEVGRWKKNKETSQSEEMEMVKKEV